MSSEEQFDQGMGGVHRNDFPVVVLCRVTGQGKRGGLKGMLIEVLEVCGSLRDGLQGEQCHNDLLQLVLSRLVTGSRRNDV